MTNEHALSEIFASVLIIGLVVVLVGIVVILSSGIAVMPEKSAYISMDINNQTISTKNIIAVFHRAGDEVYLNSSISGLHGMSVNIDNRTSTWKAQAVLGLNTVKPGTTLLIYYNASKKVYRITTNAATLSTNESQPVVDCPLQIRVVDETARLLLSSWNWTCVPQPPTGPAPTVTSINSTTGYRGWPIIESIAGTYFLNGATAKFNRTGAPDIPATSCTFVSSTSIICTFDLLAKTASPPNYNVVVTNPEGKSGMRANYFVLSSTAPTITSSTPATGAQAATVSITYLRGTYFQPGATVTYSQGVTSLPLTGVTVVSSTNITGTLAIPSNAPTGAYNVTVTNTDGKTVTRTSTFTVTSNAPTVAAITNATGYRGWPVIESITGTNFQDGATAKFNRSDGAPELSATSCTFASSTRINCTFNINAGTVSPPTYNIVVTNPDGKQGMRANVFTLSSAAPTITTSTPNSGLQAATVPITNLVGTNFQPGAVVVYRQGTTDINLASVNVVSRTQIIGTLVIPSGAPTGSYWVNITNPDAKTGGTAARFTVISNAPTVTSITNGSGNRGWPVIESIVGTNFVSGATVKFNRTLTADIPASSCTYVSATLMNCIFDLTGRTASPPNYNLVVTNPDGKQGMRATAFTLNSAAPAVTLLTPNTGARGATVNINPLTGTGFQPGASVNMTQAGYVINANSVVVVSPTQITCTFVIPALAPAGAYSVGIMNTDGRNVLTANRFTVT
jgi:hypothetical protein